MEKVPGYDNFIKHQARDAAKRQRAANKEERKYFRAMVSDPSAVAQWLAVATGGTLCPATFLWMADKIIRPDQPKVVAGVSLLTFVILIFGGFTGVALYDQMRRRAGVRVIEKINNRDKLPNRLDQYRLSRLFTPDNISALSVRYPRMFHMLCDDLLPHISYDAATAIMDGHLRCCPGDYYRLKSNFKEDSIPAKIRATYGKNER